MKVVIGDKEFKVKSLFSEEGRRVGLRGVEKLRPGHGVALRYKSPQSVTITMEDVLIDLGIVYILNDQVVSVLTATAGSGLLKSFKNIDTVVEVNADEVDDIAVGDIVRWVGHVTPDGRVVSGELLHKYDKELMLVLDPDGNVQGSMRDMSRIHSRKDTAKLYDLSVAARASGKDEDFKKIGRAVVRIIARQDDVWNED